MEQTKLQGCGFFADYDRFWNIFAAQDYTWLYLNLSNENSKKAFPYLKMHNIYGRNR